MKDRNSVAVRKENCEQIIDTAHKYYIYTSAIEWSVYTVALTN